MARRQRSAYYLEIGVDALQTLLYAGINDLLASACVSPTQVTYALLGLLAYGENAQMPPFIDGIVADVLPIARCRCANDMVCGWAGALAGEVRINIVAGTGSTAYGEFESPSARAGGWGELFSDEGSAYWVAREPLSLFSRMSDGRTARAQLYDLIREHFRARADFDVGAAVYGPPPLTRSEIGALALIVLSAAQARDLAARGIFEAAAHEPAAIVHAVRDNLGVPPEVRLSVSYSGGMFRPESLTLTLLRAVLAASDRHYAFAAPHLSPIAGAVLYAAKHAGAPLNSQAVAQLTRTHSAVPDSA